MDEQARGRLMKVALVAIPVVMLFSVGFAYVMFHLVSPPPKGPPFAVQDIRSGQPFEVPFVSDGKSARIFLDLRCESCSFPVTGSFTLTAGDRTIHKAEVSAGDLRDRAWGGHDRWLDQQLIHDGPAPAAGTRVVLRGMLSVGPALDWKNSPVKGAPPATLKVFRLTIAP
jgi:hypothetical protein